MTKYIVIALVVVGALVVIFNMSSMGNTSEGSSEFFVASAFNGKLVDESGAAVSGAKVTRKVRVRPEDEYTVHESVTDENGSFSFPAIHLTGWWNNFSAKYLPGTAAIKVVVEAEHNGEPKVLFQTVKTNLDSGGELPDGGSINLTCDISKEPSAENSIKVWGVCE